MKYMVLVASAFALASSIQALPAFAGSLSAKGSMGGLLMPSQPGWDYSPSAMSDLDGKEKVWWCGAQNGRDVVKYSERTGTGAWSQPQVVLQASSFTGTPLSWEGALTCDPTVVRGSWSYNGTSYGYAMYYTTNDPSTSVSNNRIGLAFSKNGISWVKYTYAPVINDGNTGNQYGTGQAVAMSTNGGSGVRIFYTFVDHDGSIHYFVRESTDGINFGGKSEISQAGLTLNGVPGLSHRNAAIAIVPVSANGRYAYYLANVCETYNDSRDGAIWGTAKGVCVYRIEGNSLYTGTWERVLDSGHVKPVEVEPGFSTSIYGYINSADISLYFACSGDGDPNSWELCQAGGQSPESP
jgi:hypothetical protein